MSRARERAGEGAAVASLRETLSILAQVAVPTLAKGVIVRRPRAVAMSQRFDLEGRAIRRLQALRHRHGAGPVLFPVPFRKQAIILNAADVETVLAGAPEPFAPASAEKASALGHFEPDVSLISTPPERAGRRQFNETVLEFGGPVHSMADTFMRVVDEEMRDLMAGAGDELRWEAFFRSWNRIVRRLVLGDGARDDEEVTAMLKALRSAANWAFMHPGRPKVNKRFHDRVNAHLARADPGSLAGTIAQLAPDCRIHASHQIAHYLFAFDPGGMATYRTLALLAAHPDAIGRVRDEVVGKAPRDRRDLTFTRAAYVECLRLFPTTPAIFRETTEGVELTGKAIPKGTNLLIFAPFFHRDDEQNSDAHRFKPEAWVHRDPTARLPLVPFSAGPAACPAKHFVPMIGTAAIAAILQAKEVELVQADVLQGGKMPSTLDHYSLSFRLKPRF